MAGWSARTALLWGTDGLAWSRHLGARAVVVRLGRSAPPWLLGALGVLVLFLECTSCHSMCSAVLRFLRSCVSRALPAFFGLLHDLQESIAALPGVFAARLAPPVLLEMLARRASVVVAVPLQVGFNQITRSFSQSRPPRSHSQFWNRTTMKTNRSAGV